MALISIIMPIKNAELYLNECLDSIVNQSYKNWELIAVNDHSDDDTPVILEAYSQLHSNISWLNNEGEGITPALQTGYKHTQGDYITRMDSDDLMPAEKLEIMLKSLQEEDNHTLVTGYVEYFSEDGVGDGFTKYQHWLNQLVDLQSHAKEMYKECVIPSPCWMTRKATFDKVGAFDSEVYPEDYDLTFRFYLNDVKIVGIPHLLHLWRDHGKRTSRTHEHYAVNSFLSLKVSYFLKLSHDSNKQLVLWGAGKKGKEVARLLHNLDVEFDWICNNPHKIGVTYLDRQWQDCNQYFVENTDYQVIGLVSKPSDQDKIKTQINALSNVDDYWFC